MIIRLLLAVLVIAAIVHVVRTIQRKPPAQRPRYYMTVVLGLVAGALILLALTGRVHWIGALIGAALPFLRRLAPLLMRLIPFLHYQRRAQAAAGGSGAGNVSEVNTDTLHMVMDHDTGNLHGDVRAGPFAGMALDALEPDELRQLLDYCLRQDADAARLLQSYLKHRFGEQWDRQQTASAHEDGMSRKLALQILGLREGATRDDIIEAHRRLIQKLHPDRGGNDYLASQINLAKSVLLDE